MRVLVTGAAGLYGFHVIEELAANPEVSKIYGVDDFSRGFPREEEYMDHHWGEKVTITKQMFQDITVREINSLNVDVVIHLAGYNSGKESMNTPEEYFLNNEYGTFQLVHTLLRTRNRPFLIYASSTEVYGEHIYSPVDEKHPVNPQNIFSATKLAAEKHVMAAGRWYNYPVTALRFTNTFGENQNIYGYTSVVSSFIDRALRNEPLIIYGSGEQTRDFLYAKDAARALCAASAAQKPSQGLVINIATGLEMSVFDLAEKVKKLTDSTSEIINLPCEKGEPGFLPIDNAAALQTLAWSPRYDLDEGLSRTICWYKGLRSL